MSEVTDVVVELEGDGRIHLYSAPPWEVPGLLPKIKSIPGANFRKTPTPHWTYPQSMDTMRTMRRVFEDLLVMGPDLMLWVRAAAAEEAARCRLAHLKNIQLKALPEWDPELYASLRKSQRVGAKYIAQRPSIIADQPGLGKTVQWCSSLVEGDRLEGVHLIAAPVTALDAVWRKELKKWLGMDATIVTGGAARRHTIIDDFFREVEQYPPEEGYAHFLVVNPEMLQIKQKKTDDGKVVSEEIRFPQLFSRPWTTFTVDEAQDYILGIKNATRMTQTGLGLMRVDAGHKTAISGTPFKGRPLKLWCFLHWLYPDVYRSYWQFVETYFHITDNGFGKDISDDPREDMKEEFYHLLDTVMIRRTKAEVIKELPPVDQQDVWVDMTPNQKKQYDDFLLGAEAKFGDVHVSATGILAELTRCSQIASAVMTAELVEHTRGDRVVKELEAKPTIDSGKIIWLEEALRERGVLGDDRWGEDKFVIASQSTEMLLLLERWLSKTHNVPTLRIDGSVSASRRTQAQQLFQAPGGARIMLIQTLTAKAIDLDAHCDEMFILDETFVPDDQEQLINRIHRASRIHQVTVWFIRTRNSIDENRMTLVADKENLQKTILDGRRGVEFARKLMGRS